MPEIVDGVHITEISTPFPVGNVNCYLIEGSPLTLIDTGPFMEESLQVMEKSLLSAGYAVSDIEQILLTHGHVDHSGNAHMLQKAIMENGDAPPDVWIHEMDAYRVSDYEGYIDRRMQSYLDVISSGGVTDNIKAKFSKSTMAAYFKQFGKSVPSIKKFDDRSGFETGLGSIDAIWTPGHSLGSVCFVLREQCIIFCGDHVLGTISSNPSLDFEGKLGISMERYLKSLESIEPFSDYLPLPGHREPLFDLGLRIDDLKQDYKTKIQRTLTILDEIPQTLYEISRKLYGDYAEDSLILALAETHDLVRILERKGKARVTKSNDVVHVSA